MEAQTQMQIPLFNGDDHEIWSIKMKTLLMARDLWDVVERGFSDEKLLAINGGKDLRIKDMTALHMLQTSVTETIFLRIGRATSSKQAWELLKAEFGETDQIRVHKRQTVNLEFSLMVMKKEESVHQFIEKVVEIVSRLKFYYGDLCPDFIYIDAILSKLPPRFSETRDILIKGNFTLTEVLQILRETERRNELKERDKASDNHKTPE